MEVGDQLAVRRGGGMVEFVDDDVVESVWGEPLEMFSSAQSLDRREHDVGIRVLRVTAVMAKRASGRTRRKVSSAWFKISSRWATNSTRRYSGRLVSKAESHVFPRPVARTTRPALFPAARVCSSASRAARCTVVGVTGGLGPPVRCPPLRQSIPGQVSFRDTAPPSPRSGLSCRDAETAR